MAIVPNLRTKSSDADRSLSNSFLGFVIQAVGSVDNRSQIRELVDNFKQRVVDENTRWIGCSESQKK